MKARQHSGQLVDCPLGNSVSVSAKKLALVCHTKTGCLGKRRQEPANTFWCLTRFNNISNTKGWCFLCLSGLRLKHTLSFFHYSLGFTCQSDFDAGPVPPTPRIRHHSGGTITQTSRWCLPKTQFHPVVGTRKTSL